MSHSGGAARPPVTAARRVAFEILTLVEGGKGHSDDLLHSARTAGLSAEDRGLTTALVMGVLRWQIALDAQIARYVSRPDQKIPAGVALALRMGAFQLLHMDRIPAHAALSESVELCRFAGQPQAAGMVNAVLRKLATAKRPGVPLVEQTAAFAQRLGHPAWLVERWVREYGRAAAMGICEYDQQEPRGGELFGEASAAEGMPEMDDGSRLVAELAAAVAPTQAGRPRRVWDCCAAPGGKTLILASRLPDAEILASDISARRMDRMRARLHGQAGAAGVRYLIADAAAGDVQARLGLEAEDGFDLIVCDVPCSGTGTLARNPEIRLLLKTEELKRQAERQRAILGNAVRLLNPGGRLVYSTCSLEWEENEAVVQEVMGGGRLRQVRVEEAIGEVVRAGVLPEEKGARVLAAGVREGALRTVPGMLPCDGFFASVWERAPL